MKRCFIETVAKTGLFGATEYVLYRIPDNTDNRDPVYGVDWAGELDAFQSVFCAE